MPIYDTDECRQLHFGYGDIEVGGGVLEEGGQIRTGAVIFMENGTGEIGKKTVYAAPGVWIPVNQTPVRMIFDKTESIDVVIRELEKAKKLMLEEITPT